MTNTYFLKRWGKIDPLSNLKINVNILMPTQLVKNFKTPTIITACTLTLTLTSNL